MGPRRRFLAALGMAPALLSGLSACGTLVPGDSLEGDAQAERVAEGVWVLPGARDDIGPANRGRVGNAGFIVGPTGVLVIDSGVSLRHGDALRAAVARVTSLPIRALILTHVRQEFLFGARAFQRREVPVHMHRQAAGLMAARCERCLRTLREVLGEAEMDGTALVKPDVLLDGPGGVIEGIGRPVRWMAWGQSSGPGDTAVFDPTSGVLFAGGLMDQEAVPDVQDSDLPGWHQALHDLQALPLARIIPGHGPVAGPGLIARTERYLQQLEGRVAELLRTGKPLSEVADAAALPEFAGWAHHDTIHRRNASVVYLRQERAMLSR
jgi:glyoxylase-like metal-dependent hydrolase (beta-lactamase superfamily II)